MTTRCPTCARTVPPCEYHEYARCEDCWVEQFILSFEWSLLPEPAGAKLTAREAEVLFGTIGAT